MADNRRQSVGGKPQLQAAANSTTGPGISSVTVPLDVALGGAIGAQIRITTAPPTASTLEGTLFTACPIVNLVAINTSANTSGSTQSGDYHLIPISRIQSFQILSLAPALNGADGGCFANAQPSIHALDVRTLKTREMNAVAKLQEQEARRGKGVTREAQELFDAFSRTTPARWDGTSIVVADAVVIAKPYRVDDCRSLAAGDSAALTRVRKVLEMERKKIELRNSSATIGNSNNFSRQTAAISTNAGVKDRVAVPNHLDATVVGQRKGG